MSGISDRIQLTPQTTKLHKTVCFDLRSIVRILPFSRKRGAKSNGHGPSGANGGGSGGGGGGASAHNGEGGEGGSAPAVPEGEEGFWDCSMCTFRNHPEAFKCSMCDVRKGTSTRQ